MANKKVSMNGSVNLLADAMRKVFSEAVEGAVEPLREDISTIGKDMASIREDMAKLDATTTLVVENMTTKEDLETTNLNMQAQFSEQEKKIGQLLKASR